MAAELLGLPIDLAWLVLSKVPDVALQLEPAERVQLVHRMTGHVTSDERAYLVLEQLAAGNRDFDDPDLVVDEEAWREALPFTYSPRAFDAAMKAGCFKRPLSFAADKAFYAYMVRALSQGADNGLALLHHLETNEPQLELLTAPEILEVLAYKVTHRPTIDHLLRRLLNADDSCFATRKALLADAAPYTWMIAVIANANPFEILVLELVDIVNDHGGELQRSGWTGLPLLAALVETRPIETRALLVHYQILELIHNSDRDGCEHLSLLDGIRPPMLVSYAGCPTRIQVVSGDEKLAGWLIDDWLAQARRTGSWRGFAHLLSALTKGVQHHAITKFVDSVPVEVLVLKLVRKPRMLSPFLIGSCSSHVPARLVECVPFDAWLTASSSLYSVRLPPSAFACFGARQRVLLRRACLQPALRVVLQPNQA
jgi:hypothetical protein